MSTKDKKSFDERMKDLEAKTVEDIRKTREEMKQAWQPIKKPFLFIIGAIVLITVFVANGPSGQERYCNDTDSASRLAYAAAVVHVRQRLNDPDSAEFPAQAISVSRTGDCSFLVVGTVRARNALGGLVLSTYVARTDYDIEAEYTRVSLISLD
ncbi:hypothetical protein [Aestuariivita sp.]|jgi:hypothetical protein|uniref:hypothetical protein n=1 Tax=Aestuariivita sp. TaxID=1872407 RepID=UPI00216EAE11|nr:hypothetical protein [Aestuariivita sp.]MCE8006161.1 hypothetical protein [Aestuariivita sp.]